MAVVALAARIAQARHINISSHFYIAPTVLIMLAFFLSSYADLLRGSCSITEETAYFLFGLSGAVLLGCIPLVPMMDILCWKRVKNRKVLWGVLIAFPLMAWIVLLHHKF